MHCRSSRFTSSLIQSRRSSPRTRWAKADRSSTALWVPRLETLSYRTTSNGSPAASANQELTDRFNSWNPYFIEPTPPKRDPLLLGISANWSRCWCSLGNFDEFREIPTNYIKFFNQNFREKQRTWYDFCRHLRTFLQIFHFLHFWRPTKFVKFLNL